MNEKNDLTVVPHPSLDDWFQVGEWSFDLSDKDDSRVEFARAAAQAWTTWAEYLEALERSNVSDTLF